MYSDLKQSICNFRLTLPLVIFPNLNKRKPQAILHLSIEVFIFIKTRHRTQKTENMVKQSCVKFPQKYKWKLAVGCSPHPEELLEMRSRAQDEPKAISGSEQSIPQTFKIIQVYNLDFLYTHIWASCCVSCWTRGTGYFPLRTPHI